MGSVKILKASAGSGKTYQLSYEYVKRVVFEPFAYKSILAVTFTNKATKEMKRRIVEEISKIAEEDKSGFLDSIVSDFIKEKAWLDIPKELVRSRVVANAQKALYNILHDYSSFSVMTIDRFFQRVYRAFCKELGIDSTFEIELDNSYFLGMSVDAVIEKYYGKDRVLEQYLDERIDENKRFDYRDDLQKVGEKIFTKEFNTRQFIDNYDSIVSYFENLSNEKENLTARFVDVAKAFLNEIHSKGLTSSDFIQKNRGLYPLVVSWSKGEFKPLNSYVKKMLDISSKWGGDLAEDAKFDLHKFLVILNNSLKSINNLSIMLDKHREMMLMINIAKELDSVLKTNNVLLLASSIKVITSLVNGNSVPYIYEKLGSRYEVMMIDEFQDTSSEQWESFSPLVANILSESQGCDVLLVGDLKQSIYAWRGGDWRILEYEVVRDLESSGSIETENLETNWRSDENIVTFNNQIIRHGVKVINNDLNKMLDSENVSGDCRNKFKNIAERIYNRMEQSVAPKNIGSGGYVEFLQFDGEDNSNLFRTVEIIEQAQERGYSPNEIVILVRSKSKVKDILSYIDIYKSSEKAKSGISYEVVSRDGLLLKYSNAVNFIISCYKIFLDNDDAFSIIFFNSFLYGVASDKLKIEDKEVLDRFYNQSLCETFETICDNFGLANHSEIAYIQALHAKIIECSNSVINDARHFVDKWENDKTRWCVNSVSRQDCISIETIHAVKGLEYKIVIIPYCDWKLNGMAKDIWLDNGANVPEKLLASKNKLMIDSDYADEYVEDYILERIEAFNIFYVALTRAESELYLMTPNPSSKLQNVSLQDIICYSLRGCKGADETLFAGVFGELESKSIGDIIYFGEPKAGVSKEIEKTSFIETYYSEDYKNHAVVRCSNERYFEKHEQSEISVRELGILKHKLFERIKYMSDVEVEMNRMEHDGELSSSDVKLLKDEIENIFSDELISNWYSDKWEVRNENSILIYDDSLHTYRPDRVVTFGDEAIVVDYKFGKVHNKHKKQVSNYMNLLSQMGYIKIKGYLWYLTNGEVVEVVV